MNRRLAIAAAVAFAAVVAGTVGARWYTDFLWFSELGYQNVFWTSIGSRLALLGVMWLISAAALYLGWRLALGCLPGIGPVHTPERVMRLQVLRFSRRAALWVAIALGWLTSYSMSAAWLKWRLALSGRAFGIADPLFGHDVSFYAFILPVYEQALALASILLTLVTLGGGAVLVLGGAIEPGHRRIGLVRPARTWVAVIVALWLVIRALGYRMQMFGLLFSPGGTVHGAGYSEVHALLPGLRVLLVLCLAGAAFVLVAHRRRSLLVLAVPVAVVAVASLLSTTVYPGFVQQFRVSPNELAMERPYLEHSITFTRAAYGLDRIRTEPYDIAERLTFGDIVNHRETVDNIRVWDWRPLLQTYKQLQEIRLYYNFRDVDVDRYRVDDRLRQVMVSARELNREQLPVDAQNWINLHLKYTHGYGAVVSPSNEAGADGLPVLWLRDVPPVAAHAAFALQRPEIYYGEQPGDYVIVNTAEGEFSHFRDGQNVYTHYDGRGGVKVGSMLARTAFAARFSSYRILLSDAIKADSRIMMHRDIRTRVSAIAPFLIYDQDPYLVIADGRLYWIMDAYTVSDRYPYSQPHGNFNYIRNSVKVVIDAYHGDVRFYAVEPEPVVAALDQVFPGLLRPMEEMPEYLRAHLRVPEYLYTVMADMLTLYHMQDPTVFYNREDLWRIPSELYAGREQRMDPYYLIMKLPGEDEAEFVLILPFTPAGRENLIGLLAARCDAENYGEFILCQLSKERLVYGPMQIEARISQDSEISQLLTLWGQRGSEVIRGNLLVIPIENSILYVEPLYLQSTDTRIPELRRVIGAWGTTVVMDTEVKSLLRRLLTGGPAAIDEELDDDTAALVNRAASLIRTADERIRAGDWAGYGSAVTELRDILIELERRFSDQP